MAEEGSSVETLMEGTFQPSFPCCDKQSRCYLVRSTEMLQQLGLPVLEPVQILFQLIVRSRAFGLCLPDTVLHLPLLQFR